MYEARGQDDIASTSIQTYDVMEACSKFYRVVPKVVPKALRGLRRKLKSREKN